MSYYVTTAINYVNAVPHLGHAYEAITADVMARNARARGESTFFLTGTDEHGEPVALAAAAEGVAPLDLADRNAERFRALTATLEISNDFFIRTTDPGHVVRVQEILQRVHDAGHVYLGTYEGWYCPRCADFKTEAEMARTTTVRSTASRSSARARRTGSSASQRSRSASRRCSTAKEISSCRATPTTRRGVFSPAG